MSILSTPPRNVRSMPLTKDMYSTKFRRQNNKSFIYIFLNKLSSFYTYICNLVKKHIQIRKSTKEYKISVKISLMYTDISFTYCCTMIVGLDAIVLQFFIDHSPRTGCIKIHIECGQLLYISVFTF